VSNRIVGIQIVGIEMCIYLECLDLAKTELDFVFFFFPLAKLYSAIEMDEIYRLIYSIFSHCKWYKYLDIVL